MRAQSQIRQGLNTTIYDQYANLPGLHLLAKIDSKLPVKCYQDKNIHSNNDINKNFFVMMKKQCHLHTFLGVMSSGSFVLSLFFFRTWFPIEAGSLLLCLVSCSDLGHSSGPSP